MTQFDPVPMTDDAEALGADASVLIVCLSIRHGGVDVRVRQTAEELARRGINYRVVVIAGSVLHRALAASGIAVHPLARLRGDPRIVGDLVRLIRTTKATIIDAHNSQSQLWVALAAMRSGIKGRVATTHSVYREDHPQRWKQIAHEQTLHLCRVAGFSFIAVSRSVEGYLLRTMHVPPDRVTLSRNGIGALPAPPPPCDLVAAAGWPEDAVVLGMIGRLDLRKGHRLAILAVEQIVRAGAGNVGLLIVGTGREEVRLRALIAERGMAAHVHLAGFRTDVPSILSRTDMFLLPSFSEGLPYAVLEAARQGVPTLSSRLEGTEDSFVDGQTIFFVPPGDQAALTTRLGSLVQDKSLLRTVGAAARAMVERDLGLQRMTAETVKVYKQTTNR